MDHGFPWWAQLRQDCRKELWCCAEVEEKRGRREAYSQIDGQGFITNPRDTET
ncbi:MAG: hypothetical protein WBG01_07175 [Bacteroidota bacterium]